MKRFSEILYYSWFLVLIFLLLMTVFNAVKYGFNIKSVIGVVGLILGLVFLKLYKKKK